MNKKYLITASLYGAYSYYTQTDFEKYDDKAEEIEEKARQDWLNCLNKVKTPTTEVQQRGINFENAVYELTRGIERVEGANGETLAHGLTELPACNLLDDAEYATAQEIAEKVKGGMWQETVCTTIGNYVFYGKADIIRGNTIFDIKRVNKYDLGKYLKSIQHLIYMESSGIDNFRYVISDGSNVYTEDYHRDADTRKNLLARTNQMIAFIRGNEEFNAAFEKNWHSKY